MAQMSLKEVRTTPPIEPRNNLPIVLVFLLLVGVAGVLVGREQFTFHQVEPHFEVIGAEDPELSFAREQYELAKEAMHIAEASLIDDLNFSDMEGLEKDLSLGRNAGATADELLHEVGQMLRAEDVQGAERKLNEIKQLHNDLREAHQRSRNLIHPNANDPRSLFLRAQLNLLESARDYVDAYRILAERLINRF